MSAPAFLRAQVAAEVKTRLRSTSTAVAAVAILVASFKWIPDPASGGVSISWTDPAGKLTSGIYNSAYVGTSAGVLASLFLSLIGFYLVAGSVRRDRDSRVGLILGATPLSKAAYLGGKVAAHTVYLWTIGLVSLAGGLLVFLRFGQGPFQPLEFVVPWLVFVAPALFFVAVLAVAFDVTPGLRGPFGYVAYFFVWTFLLLVLPGLASGGMGPGETWRAPPYYDPIAMGAVVQMIEESTALRPGEVSIGLQYGVGEMALIDWPGLRYSAGWLGVRSLTFLWALLPFGIAWLFFDRFDPARRAGRKERKERKSRELPPAAAGAEGAAAAARQLSLSGLPPVACRPSPLRSVLAETRLLWNSAGLWRWLLPAAALAAAIPGPPGQASAAALLLLLAPAIGELAAREKLAGTWPLILGQPGVPRSLVLWKLAAGLVFVLALGLPRLLVTLPQPELALGWLCGLAFVAGFAVAAGSLTGGGKLFSGIYVALWYTALNGAPFADYAAVLSPSPALATSAVYAALGLAAAGAAALFERRRLAGGH